MYPAKSISRVVCPGGDGDDSVGGAETLMALMALMDMMAMMARMVMWALTAIGAMGAAMTWAGMAMVAMVEMRTLTAMAMTAMMVTARTADGAAVASIRFSKSSQLTSVWAAVQDENTRARAQMYVGSVLHISLALFTGTPSKGAAVVKPDDVEDPGPARGL